MKNVLLLCILLVAHSVAHAQGFGLKEIFTYKDHDIDFFHKEVRAKGYSYERSKSDERDGYYEYVYLHNIDHDFHEIIFDNMGRHPIITFGSTDVKDYERMKSDLELLEFKFVKYVPKQEHGRSVLMMVYSDGRSDIHLYNSYIECPDKQLVRYYRIKVL